MTYRIRLRSQFYAYIIGAQIGAQKSGGIMAVSYEKYRRLLKKTDMSASRLGRKADIAPNTMTRLQKDEPVSLDVLGRLCSVLHCNFGDLVDYVPEKE